jgi:hypothetical protein
MPPLPTGPLANESTSAASLPPTSPLALGYLFFFAFAFGAPTDFANH